MVHAHIEHIELQVYLFDEVIPQVHQLRRR